MKLRLARKILANMDKYSEGKLCAALRRMKRTRSAKEDNAYWAHLMGSMTPGEHYHYAIAAEFWSKAAEIIIEVPRELWNVPYSQHHSPHLSD